MKHASPALGICIAIASALLLSGCGEDSGAELIASAKSHLEKNDAPAAVIQLRNALQKNPQSAEARFLLGKTLLASGDMLGASVELQKALDLKYSTALVVPELARALLKHGELDKVTERYGRLDLGDPSATADLKTSVATAYAMKGDREKAQAVLDTAIGAAPKYAPARLLQARLKANAADPQRALGIVSDVIAADPLNFEAWYLRGVLLAITQRDTRAAVDAYRKCLVLRKDYLPAHAGIISTLLQANDLDGAKTQLDALRNAWPRHPQTKFFDVQLAYLRHDFKTAREIAQPLLTAQPDNAKLLELAGAVEYEAGSLSEARALLAKALQKGPDLLLARRLMAQILLRQGQPAQAIAVLRPRVEGNDSDAQTLSLAGQASLESGDAKKAETYFRRAASAKPDDTRIRTSLALAQLSTGSSASALGELQALAAKDDGSGADLALISALLHHGDLAGALKAIDALQRKQPANPNVAMLRGRVLLSRDDQRGARASFEQALKIDPRFYPATASMVAIDLRENKPEQARKRLESLLSSDPANHQAALALADLRGLGGATQDEVVALIADAVKRSPGEPAPRVALVNRQLAARDFRRALLTAQEAVAVLPDDPQVLEALGSAQLAAGDLQQALATFNKVAVLQPSSAQLQLRLADIYIALNDPGAAARSLKRAIEITPDLLAAQRALIGLAVAAKAPDDALMVARTVQHQRPGQAIGFALEGDIQASHASWEPALLAYRAAFQKAPTTELAAKIESALTGAGKKAEAATFAADWQKSHPHDAAFLAQLAESALTRREFVIAEARYRALIQVRPNDAAAMNNIAWLMIQQKKQGAVAYAENALRLMPDQPAFMDTLALALMEDGKLPKAIEMQKKAVQVAPDNYFFRLNLARIYITAGDNASARAELETLAKLGAKFPAQTEVARLLKSV